MGSEGISVQTPAECRAAGKEARAKVKRSSHGDWKPEPDRPDPIAVLEKQAEIRVSGLVPIRHGRMLDSPFAFFRGGAAIMAWDLAHTPNSGLRVQLCGDAHLSNFGAFAAPDRRLVFDINDFDETLPGPWEWDVKRLTASITVAGRGLGLGKKQRAAAVTAAVREYRETIGHFAEMRHLDVWNERLEVEHMLERWKETADRKRVKAAGKTFLKAHSKDSLRAMSKLVHEVDGRKRIISDPPLIVPIEELADEGDVENEETVMRERIELYAETIQGAGRHLIDGYRYAHLARKVVGVGSVGTRAWILLMLGRDDGDPLVLQLKEADPSVLAPYAGASKFKNQGRRVVEGQWLMQAAGDPFMGWFSAEGLDRKRRDFYARQLWDWKASAEVDRMTANELSDYAKVCGWVLARAHARSGDRIAISAYLGVSDSFDKAIVSFSERYAEQNERDHQALVDAVDGGRIAAQSGI